MLTELNSELFVTAFAAIYNIENGKFRYVNAGHNPPIIYKTETRSCAAFGGDGIVLGILDDIKLTERSIILSKDEIVVLYTDGATESFNELEVQFGEERLMELISANSDVPVKDLRNRIFEEIGKFCGGSEQFDDISLLILRRKI